MSNKPAAVFATISVSAIAFITYGSFVMYDSSSFLYAYKVEQNMFGTMNSGPAVKIDSANSSLAVNKVETIIQEKSYLERMDYYKSRYNYKAPEWYPNQRQRGDTCGEYPTYTSYFNLTWTKERSANNEDITLYRILFLNEDSPPIRGSMLEIGAFNGISESNSRFFDTCLGWDTLLI